VEGQRPDPLAEFTRTRPVLSDVAEHAFEGHLEKESAASQPDSTQLQGNNHGPSLPSSLDAERSDQNLLAVSRFSCVSRCIGADTHRQRRGGSS
jgi:hypothetical protein